MTRTALPGQLVGGTGMPLSDMFDEVPSTLTVTGTTTLMLPINCVMAGLQPLRVGLTPLMTGLIKFDD
jgi:hypothetical protein